MVTPDPDHPAYAAARHIQRTRGRDLLARHGAHALGVEWAPVGAGRVEPVLVFHVAATAQRPSAAEPVPPSIVGRTDDGREVAVATRVRTDPQARFE